MNSEAKKEIIKMLADYEQIFNDDFRNRHSYRDAFPKWAWYKYLKKSIKNMRDLRKCVDVLNGNCVPQPKHEVCDHDDGWIYCPNCGRVKEG